jgi:23S rRNA (cytosine1962-C5)-methyltransferase
MPSVTLKRGRAKPFWYRHPWVFSGAVRDVSGAPRDGDIVDLVDDEGRFIGRGFFNSSSQIVVRVCTWDSSEAVDADFFRARIYDALRLRRDYLGLPNPETDAYRLVHSEGDGIPGLVVDVYGRVASVQFSSVGLRRWEEEILDCLEGVLDLDSILEHPSEFSTEKEGMHAEAKTCRGADVDSEIVIRENGLEYEVDVRHGQKTGFFLDQRENRRLLAGLVRGRRVLDAYCYTGGFGLAAIRLGGATEVIGVDSSEGAIRLARANAERNGLDGIRFEEAEVSAFLHERAASRDLFGVVVLDPPKFARSKGDLPAAAGKYREINRQAIEVVEKGGLLVTCSCSQHLGPDAFAGILNEAAKATGRSLQVLYRRSQGPDHAVRTSCPEGEYLKFFVVRVV